MALIRVTAVLFSLENKGASATSHYRVSKSSTSSSIPWLTTKRPRNNHNLERILSQRGGYSSGDSDPYSTSTAYGAVTTPTQQHQHQQITTDSYQAEQEQQQLQQAEQEEDDGFYYPPDDAIGVGGDDPLTETVQQRVEQWKAQQREQATLTENNIPNKAQENASLLATVSKGSRTIIFFFLMWRDIHLFEIADQALKGSMRVFLVTPLVFLFVANLLGAVASLAGSQSHGTKRRLKAILNADKLVEVFLLAFYFIRLTIAPSKYTPREIYVANVCHSILFLLQCQAFTRVSWDDKNQPQYTRKEVASSDDAPNEVEDLAGQPYYTQQGNYQQPKSQNYGAIYETNPQYGR